MLKVPTFFIDLGIAFNFFQLLLHMLTALQEIKALGIKGQLLTHLDVTFNSKHSLCYMAAIRVYLPPHVDFLNLM